MNLIPSALPLLASCLVLGLLVACVRGWRAPRSGVLEVSPRYRALFRQHGLIEPEHFLALPGKTPHIVSGHPDRNVARVQFGSGPRRWVAFLKREHRVSRSAQLANALAGFGFVSRSVREARTLQALQREGICGPEWLAAGEDGQGRAFLLVREVVGAELRSVLRDEQAPARRRRIAHNLGVTLARLHSAGFRHPDLYANHLFVEPREGSIHVLDWQRATVDASARLGGPSARPGGPACDPGRDADHAARTSALPASLLAPRPSTGPHSGASSRASRTMPGACWREGTSGKSGRSRCSRKHGFAWMARPCA